MPQFLLDYTKLIPTRENKRFRQTSKVIDAVAKELVDEKGQALLAGDQSSRDIMSVLSE